MNRLVYCGPVAIELLYGNTHQITGALFHSGGNFWSAATGSYVVKNAVIRGSGQIVNRLDHAELLFEAQKRIAWANGRSHIDLHFADVKFHGLRLTVDARKPLKRNICFDECDLYVQGLRNGPYGASDFGFRHTIIRDCTLKGLLVHPDGSAHDMSSLHLRFFAKYNPHKLRMEGTNG